MQSYSSHHISAWNQTQMSNNATGSAVDLDLLMVQTAPYALPAPTYASSM